MLSDVLTDILDHTHGLSFIEMAKVTTDKEETKIEAIDPDKTVVAYGKLKNRIPELEGVVGLSRMAVLQGYLKFQPFKEDTAKVEVATQERNGEQIPAEVRFSSDEGHTASYRFMHKDVTQELIKVPPFLGVEWDITVAPDNDALTQLAYFNGVLGQFEPIFTPKTEGTKLFFNIGGAATDRARVLIADSVSGVLSGTKSWPLATTHAILKLASKSNNWTLMISGKGLMKIEMETDLGTYEYILPGKS